MNATRPLRFLTGVALLGLGGALISRSIAAGDDDDGPATGPRNAGAAVPYGHGTRIEKVFTIDRSAADLYREWRDFENLPTIMSHLRRVEVIDERRSHWHAHGPAKTSASWDAEIIVDEPERRIAWRSVGGSLPNAGSVTFAPAPGDRGTELRIEMEWMPPGGALGRSFAHLFAGGDPGLIVESDLRRFKSKLEAGGVAVNGTDVTS